VSSAGAFTGNFKSHSKINPTKKDIRKLFVGGLPSEVNDEEFKNYFSQYGPIVDSIVMIDRETGYSRGFGFVTFEDPAVANEVLENNMKEDAKSKLLIAGKWCEVKASEPKAGQPSNNGNNNQKSGRGRGRTYGSSSNGPEKDHSRTLSVDAARTVSTLGSSASTKNVQQEDPRQDNENAVASPFEEMDHGGQVTGYTDQYGYYGYDQYGYYEQYHHHQPPPSPNAYFYPHQYMANSVYPPQMGYNPYQYSYHPPHGVPAPPMPPGQVFYNQNGTMYPQGPALNHVNYENAIPQNMHPQMVSGEENYPDMLAHEGQGQHHLPNEA